MTDNPVQPQADLEQAERNDHEEEVAHWRGMARRSLAREKTLATRLAQAEREMDETRQSWMRLAAAVRIVRTSLGMSAYAGTRIGVEAAKSYEKLLGEALAAPDSDEAASREET